MPLTGVINYVSAFIFAVLSPVSVTINNNVRQPRQLSVTWRHRTRDIRFAI